MAQAQSPHLTDIPQAIRIAASVDPSIDPGLKQQAFDYLGKVKQLCEETWRDCLSLYLQGAGAPSAGATGTDGKEKLETDLRMFCEQVVDQTLLTKPEIMSAEAQQSMYKAVVEFVEAEYVNGNSEGGQAFLRNKLAYTIAHLFLTTYPASIPTFLHPFLNLLVPSDSATSLNPSLLVIHLLIEIALEIHDNIIKSARAWSNERQLRDGSIREVIRSSGDERMAVEGLLSLANKGVGLSKGNAKWLEVTQAALKALGHWTPWVDLAVSLTPETLSFYQQLLQQDVTSLRIPAAGIIRTLAAKGMKDPSEKLQVLKVLDIVSLLDPLEQQTRNVKGDHELVNFRAALAGVIQAYGTELIKLTELAEASEDLRNEADAMLSNSIPLVLRFLSDRNPEVPTAVSPFVSDLLRTFKKYMKPPNPAQPNGNRAAAPPVTAIPLPPAKRQFLLNVLEVVVRQLEWPEDVEWEVAQDDTDADEEVAAFYAMRQSFRSVVDNIAAIDKTLHTEVVANVVVSTLERLSSQGPSGVTWQQAELAAYLVYTFGEISKSNSRAAFYDLPPELASKSSAVKMSRSTGKLGDTAMASGQSTPTGTGADVAITLLDPNAKIDFEQYPLTPLGQLLTLCMTSGLSAYPHPSVPLQFFEIAVRYVDFWKIKQGAIQPMLEALLDSRGIHHSDECVRRRVFYLISRFIKECKNEMEAGMIPVIIDNIKDTLPIRPKLVPAENPDEDVLLSSTNGKSYFQDQLHLFEAAGVLVYLTRSDPTSQMNFLAGIAGPLMAGIGAGLEQYRLNPSDKPAVLHVHHHVLALGHFAKGFPAVSDDQLEAQPYQQPFKQMTEALLEALEVMKTERVFRDAARFTFSQFVTAIGSSIGELVPRFVRSVVTEFEPVELIDFLSFLGLLMHRLKRNTFETMDMLLLPLLSRIFAVLQNPVTGTDEDIIHRRLQDAYLTFFTALMNSNLEGVFITDRNKPEFENVLTSLVALAEDSSDPAAQRQAWNFLAKSIIAWGTSAAAATEPSVFADSAMSHLSQKVASGQAVATNQHAIPKDQRAAQALPGYETFVYQRLIPAAFAVPAAATFNIKAGLPVLYDIAIVIRNMLQARGQEGVDFLLNDMLPKLQCPPEMAQQFVNSLRTQQSKDFRKTFADFIKVMRS
ncbi:pre-tRNA nuclear export protein [Vanrija albida]|uniref:Exportin-T n=1 Tax=Vanrija albida TaxID=181172 RepID=A0ABR3Q8W2_9TREE